MQLMNHIGLIRYDTFESVLFVRLQYYVTPRCVCVHSDLLHWQIS